MQQEMERLVLEAQTDLMANTDSRRDTDLRMRWQQRGYMKDALIQYVELQVQVNAELRKEQDGNPLNDTGSTESGYSDTY